MWERATDEQIVKRIFRAFSLYPDRPHFFRETFLSVGLSKELFYKIKYDRKNGFVYLFPRYMSNLEEYMGRKEDMIQYGMLMFVEPLSEIDVTIDEEWRYLHGILPLSNAAILKALHDIQQNHPFLEKTLMDVFNVMGEDWDRFIKIQKKECYYVAVHKRPMAKL